MTSLLVSEKPFKNIPLKKIGVLGLNKPSSLNALDLEITSLLKTQLLQWLEDDSLLCILIHSHCAKAFCAGGDVRQMVQALEEGDASYAFETLAQEYLVDYLIHRYPKPIMVWADGWILGGGWGLMGGASHQWVGSQSRLSMPELGIGFFPDVASAYFLNRFPCPQMGLFLVWTGAQLTGKEAYHWGLVDGVFDSEAHPHPGGVETFLEDIINLPVRDIYIENTPAFHATLRLKWKSRYSLFESGSSGKPHRTLSLFACDELNGLTADDTFYTYLEGDFLKAVQNHRRLLQGEDAPGHSKKFLRYFERAAPLSVYMSWKHFHRCRNLSLEEVFKRDYHLASVFFKDSTFRLGVRERLVHKKEEVCWPHSQLLKKGASEISFPWEGWEASPGSETLKFYRALEKISRQISQYSRK